MSKRLKVLISAYSCEPGKGSEPEVGWQWALQMARFHEVTVLTRENNRPLIEPALEALQGKQPLPHFVYHDRGPAMLHFKRRSKAVRAYYLLWQKSAREIIGHLHREHNFDLMHHVTFAAYRYPIAVWGHGAPCIWGPVGGIESVPHGLLPWHHPASLAQEITRNIHNVIQSAPFQELPKRARASTLILASTGEMHETFSRLGFQVEIMPTIGLKTSELPFRPHSPSQGPLKLLFVGNIITLKGIDLAIEALKLSGVNATFTLVGSGNYLSAAQRQVRTLGLDNQVVFLGRMPREQVLRIYPDYDLFMFPSLHDTGGYAVIEAMFNELPAICLDCGGPAVAVAAGCGTKVPIGGRKQVIADLAAAIRFYDSNRQALAAQGQAARASILRNYDWDQKGLEMNKRYLAAVEMDAQKSKTMAKTYSGMGSVTNLLHGMFSLQGVAATVVGLLLIAAVGFYSVGHLKQEANNIVNDTLPGLATAGAANATLARAYNNLLLYLTETDPQARAAFRTAIIQLSEKNTQNLENYEKAIFDDPTDRHNFNTLMVRRTNYLAIRVQVLDLADKGNQAGALQLLKASLEPVYEEYRAAGETLLQYNIHVGEQQGREITRICRVTQSLVAFIAVFLFVAGFLLGFFR